MDPALTQGGSTGWDPLTTGPGKNRRSSLEKSGPIMVPRKVSLPGGSIYIFFNFIYYVNILNFMYVAIILVYESPSIFQPRNRKFDSTN